MDNWLIICNFVISRYLLLKSGYMVYLKEDGSLDIEHINNLSLNEYMEVIGDLTEEQYKFYLSKTPINEEKQQTKVVDFLPLNEVIEKGIGVDADILLKNLREELKRKN